MTASTRGRLAAAGVLAASAVLAIAACGSSSGSGSGSPSPSPPASASRPAQGNGITTTRDPSLGTIVTDAKGFTLYRFDRDSAHPSASHCTGGCAALWPPAPASDAGSVTGVSRQLLGSVSRGDGVRQLTLNGRPLYRYSLDSKPGDTRGQGVQGTWFAATPTGGKAMAGTTGSPSPSPSSGGGYGY